MRYQLTEAENAIIISLDGELDLQFSAEARLIMQEQIDKTVRLVVDMAKVTMIDSVGISVLLESFQYATKHGKKCVLADVPPTVMRVIKLARLETVLDIAPTAEHALKDA